MMLKVEKKMRLWFWSFAVVLMCCALAQRLEVWEGDRAILPCGINNTDTDVHWCKEANEGCKDVAIKLPKGEQVAFKPWTISDVRILENSSLDILSARFERDNGSYRCQVKSSSVVELVVLPVEPVENVTVKAPVSRENTTTVVRCTVRGGNSAPNIRWYVGDSRTPVRTEVGRQGKMRTYTYQVNVTMEMNGQRLVCEASVRGRSLSDETTMTVTYKPTVMVQAFPSQYSRGDEVFLMCNAQGNPKPDVTWMYKGMTEIADELEDMTDGQRRLYKYNEHKASWNQDSFVVTVMYKIDKLTTNQTGKYTCFAWNQEGNDTADMTITVEGARIEAVFPWVMLHMVTWCVLGVVIVSVVIAIIVYRCRTTVFSRRTDPTYQTRIQPLTSVHFTNTERPPLSRTRPPEDDPSPYDSIEE